MPTIRMPRLHPVRLFAPVALLLAVPALAQGAPDHLALGKMWTYENPPLAYLEKEYGFKPDQKWLDTLRLGALRLGERGNPWCSASFVSPQGLIMTNHHCVRDQIAQIQGGNDWVKNGFAATALADEVPIPGLTVQQLVAQEDVTAKVDDQLPAGGDAEAIAKKRKENIEAITKAADEAHAGSMHQVVALYEGAVHHLYRYRVFADVRLVCAPHLQTAHYGGDPDNFTFPRWSIDFSFLRAYEGDKPADTSAHYFRWREQGAQENDLVFVPGNPGDTNRQLTVAQLETQRDVEYPLVLAQLKNGMAILKPFAAKNPGILTTVLSWENSYKAIGGMLGGLHDEKLLGLKKAHEAHFQGAIAADPALTAKYGKVWETLAQLAKRKAAVQPRVAFYVAGYSGVLERGLLVAQSLDDSLTADERKAAIEQARTMQIGGNQITEALMVDHFVRASEWLGANDPFLRAVAGEHKDDKGGVDWQAAVKALGRTALGRGRTSRELLTAEDLADRWTKSDDAGVVAARTLWPLMRAAQKEESAVNDAIAAQSTLLGQALHAVYGSNVSPDATMTLRFSDGRVLGYEYNGTVAPWATTFYGLFARGVEFGNVYPFDIPQPWLDAEAQIDMKKKVCFASTNDIVGGNSGSCVVDKDLQVVGLIFDGNIESLPNDFYYTQQRARAVSVHTEAIVEALQKVYGMGRVVEELRGRAK
jgi:hypothetical protein